MNYRDASIRGIGDFACGDQLTQLDRGRTESPARSQNCFAIFILLRSFARCFLLRSFARFFYFAYGDQLTQLDRARVNDP